MIHLRRHLPLWMLLPLAAFLAAPSFSQSDSAQFRVEKGPPLKKRNHERFIRLVRGGDGYLYAFKSTTGHYWNFAPEGESALQVIRISPELTPVDTLHVRRSNRAPMPRRIYEVIPSSGGIALLTVAQSPLTGEPALTILEPEFGQGPPRMNVRILAEMPGFKIGVDHPGIRHTYSPDSSWIALAWRRRCREEFTDNFLACMILRRDLSVEQEPFLPLKKFEDPITVREMHLLDPKNLLLTVHAISGGDLLHRTETISYGLLHSAVEDGGLSVVRFSRAKEIPVEMKILTSVPGRLVAAGWYIDQQTEQREAGVFIGEITGADTLENLVRVPLPSELRDALIRRERNGGAVAIRSSYHSELLHSAMGYAYVMHLRGRPDHGVTVQAPTGKTNNALHAWFFSPSFQLESKSVTGFLSGGQEEMMETYSWRALQGGEDWYGLATDFGKAKNQRPPLGAASYAWRLRGDGAFEPLMAEPSRREFMVLAPREMAREDMAGAVATRWVGLAVGERVWRVVRIVCNSR
jgi:hypothetical protein